MEEKKQKKEKLSYEDLQKTAGDLYQQNQQLVQRIQQMQAALESRDFDYTSFFVSMLFKVMEHSEMYSDNFVSWAAGKIEGTLLAFDNAIEPKGEEEKKANEAE